MNINRRKFLTIMGAVTIAASLPTLAKTVPERRFASIDRFKIYKSPDVVQDGDWLMVANKETVRTPPQPLKQYPGYVDNNYDEPAYFSRSLVEILKANGVKPYE